MHKEDDTVQATEQSCYEVPHSSHRMESPAQPSMSQRMRSLSQPSMEHKEDSPTPP